MKLKLTAFLATIGAASMILTSCGKTKCAPVELDGNLSCHAEITQGGKIYSADLKRADGAGWKATFTSPETIEGMEVSLFNDSCTVNFKELSYTASREELPQFGMIDLITSALDKCNLKDVECTKKDKTVTQEGKVKDLSFKAEFKDKKLSALEISNELTVKFS